MRILRRRGRDVGVQNYIDDTGVQVADVVVGFLHLEKKTPAEVEALGGKFDYYCWDLYAKVGDFYAADPKRKALQAEVLHEIEAGGNETAALAAHVASRIVDCHLATMERLGIRYDLLAHESDILRLHFWDRAFELLEGVGGHPPRDRGQEQGLLGPGHGRRRRTGPSGLDEDKIIVRSNGTVTYTGKDIAYQLWKLGRLDRDFRYRLHRTYPDGHRLWTTTSEPTDAVAPAFGHAALVYNVIDVGQSYPQRVVKAGVAALGHHDGAQGSHHLAYEKVVLSPATARALGYDVSEDEAAVKVSGRKGLGVKADDLVDLLVAKAKNEIEARDESRRPLRRGERTRPRAPSASAPCAISCSSTAAPRSSPSTWTRPWPSWARPAPTSRTRWCAPATSSPRWKRKGIAWTRSWSGPEASTSPRCSRAKRATRPGRSCVLMARSEEIADQAVRAEEVALLAKHTFAVAQAFHSYYQKPKYSLLYAESEDLRAFRTLVVDAFLRQMAVLLDLLGIPVPERM